MLINRRLKYWLLTTEYPPFYGGGISTYCMQTAEMLTANGYEVTVFVPDEKVADFRVDHLSGVRTVRFNVYRTKIQLPFDHSTRVSYEFAQIVKAIADLEDAPDVIEAQDYLGIAYYVIQFKKLTKSKLSTVPVIITLHSPAFLYLEYNKVSTYKFPEFWICEMEKHSIVAADCVISPSNFIERAIKPYLYSKEIPFSVVSNPFKAATEPLIGTDLLIGKVVCYGKLSPQKGSFELLKCFKSLWDDGHKTVLYIIGGTDIVYHPELSTMGSLVEKEYASYIAAGLLHLKGKMALEEAAKFTDDAHIVVFPSIVDNLPYAVMEMMSRGKVVLASKQGGQSEIIEDGFDGFLFDHGVEGDFKNKMLEVLSYPLTEIARVARNAIQKIRSQFNYEKIFIEKAEVVGKLVSKFERFDPGFPFLNQQPVIACGEAAPGNLLTVVIPYFNMGQYIEETLASVMRSTYPDIEVLIIDDGSTGQNDIDMLAQMEKKWGVKVIRKKNGGLARARNFGAKEARGRYLAFLDADDKVHSSYYEKAIDVLKRYNNVFFAGAWVQYFDESQKIWPTFNPQPPYLLIHNSINSSGLVYKKEAFLTGGENRPELQFGLEDYESVISMLRHGLNGVVIPEVLFYYRVRKDSMFRKMNVHKITFSYQYINERHRDYYNKFATQIINLLNENGPGYLSDNPTQRIELKTKVKNQLNPAIVSLIKKNPAIKKLALKVLRLLNK